ncbi:hypothetical protein GCM10023192_40230 [Amycolatopsis samaneae]
MNGSDLSQVSLMSRTIATTAAGVSREVAERASGLIDSAVMGGYSLFGVRASRAGD